MDVESELKGLTREQGTLLTIYGQLRYRQRKYNNYGLATLAVVAGNLVLLTLLDVRDIGAPALHAFLPSMKFVSFLVVNMILLAKYFCATAVRGVRNDLLSAGVKGELVAWFDSLPAKHLAFKPPSE